jgi:hypothetical protein
MKLTFLHAATSNHQQINHFSKILTMRSEYFTHASLDLVANNRALFDLRRHRYRQTALLLRRRGDNEKKMFGIELYAGIP